MDLLVSSRLQVLVAIFLMGILFRRDERETYNGFFLYMEVFIFAILPTLYFIIMVYGLVADVWSHGNSIGIYIIGKIVMA